MPTRKTNDNKKKRMRETAVPYLRPRVRENSRTKPWPPCATSRSWQSSARRRRRARTTGRARPPRSPRCATWG